MDAETLKQVTRYIRLTRTSFFALGLIAGVVIGLGLSLGAA